MAATHRAYFDVNGRHLSYLDFGGNGPVLLALHGHLSQGASFTQLAADLRPEWRVIALDQRGHGHSDRATEYSRQGYLADIVALLNRLDLAQVVVLGHSLGAINAYQLAARYPDRVSAFINAEGAVRLGLTGPNPLCFLLSFPAEKPTRQDMIDGLGPMASFFADHIVQKADGVWGLDFHPQDMLDSEEQVHGDHWADWLASTQPALLVRGARGVIPADQAADMGSRRPHTEYAELDTDHFIYTEDPAGFSKLVREFLASL